MGDLPWSSAMDRKRFDSFTRVFATTGSRRSAVGALVTSLLLGEETNALAKKGKGKGNNHRGDGKGKENDQPEGRSSSSDRRKHNGGRKGKGKNGNNKNHHKNDHAN